MNEPTDTRQRLARLAGLSPHEAEGLGLEQILEQLERRFETGEKERAELERDLRRGRAEHQAALESAMDAIIFTDAGHRLVAANTATTKMFGYPLEGLLGQSLEVLIPEELFDPPRELDPDFLSPRRGPLAGKQLRKVHGRRSDGQLFPVEVALGKVEDQGEPILSLAVRDVSQTLDRLYKLRQRQQELKALNATKDKFFNIIAHDLRGPFQVLLGFVDLLLRRYHSFDDAKRVEFLEHVQHSAAAAHRLLEDLLQWARLQNGKMPFRPQQVKLSALVGELLPILGPAAEKRGVRLELPEEPEVELWADEHMLRTVLRNLASNALKFTPQGGRVSLAVFPPDDGFVRLELSDSGVGISPKLLPKLFSIDQNTSTPDLDGNKGTGLGLILCHEFVKAHKGEIGVASQEGQGTTFTLLWPVSPR